MLKCYAYGAPLLGEAPDHRRKRMRAESQRARNQSPPAAAAPRGAGGAEGASALRQPAGSAAFDLSSPSERTMLNRDARDMVVALRGKPSRQPEQREQARALAVLRSPELMAGPVAAANALDPGHRVGEAIRDTLAGLKERKAPSASGSRPGNAAAGVAGVPPADIANARVFVLYMAIRSTIISWARKAFRGVPLTAPVPRPTRVMQPQTRKES